MKSKAIKYSSLEQETTKSGPYLSDKYKPTESEEDTKLIKCYWTK